MSLKTSPLSSSLVARKGQAAPTAPAPPRPTAPDVTAQASPPPAKEVLTSLSLKLDDRRYQRLKELGMRRPRRTSQDILVAALDAYLEAEGA